MGLQERTWFVNQSDVVCTKVTWFAPKVTWFAPKVTWLAPSGAAAPLGGPAESCEAPFRRCWLCIHQTDATAYP